MVANETLVFWVETVWGHGTLVVGTLSEVIDTILNRICLAHLEGVSIYLDGDLNGGNGFPICRVIRSGESYRLSSTMRLVDSATIVNMLDCDHKIVVA